MPEDVTSFVIGLRILDRPVLGVTPMSLADALEALWRDCGYTHGVMVYSGYFDLTDSTVSVLKSRSKLVNVEELFEKARLYPSRHRMLESDVVFVPCQPDSFPRTSVPSRLYRWAIEQGLPYLYVHDDDHAWFSGFHDAKQKRLFLRFLQHSFLRYQETTFRMAQPDWKRVKAGLFAHGWTLNHSLCSYGKGKAVFPLWPGTPQATLFKITEANRFSNNSGALRITWTKDTDLHVSTAHTKCPLDDLRGTVPVSETQPRT